MNASLIAQAHWPSPLGTITLAATADGLAGAWFDAQKHHPGPLAAPVDPQQRFIAQAIAELGDYFNGMPRGFQVPLDLQGTPFQRAVWQALLAVTPGRTSTYARIAQALGIPNAARAAGTAVGRNPVSIIVPCHRVLGHDGSLTGYAGGLARKAALLAIEGVTSRLPQAPMDNAQLPAEEQGSALMTAA